MKKVVTLGEIMLRFSTAAGERLSQTDRLSVNYGGAEANVAVSLSHFGYDAYFVTKVPNNPVGAAAERHLKSHGVWTNYLLKGGDAFAAGILFGIMEGLPVQQIISFATGASALKHTVLGDCNAFTKDEVFQFVGNEPGKIVR